MVLDCLALLSAAGVVERRGSRWTVMRPLSVDTRLASRDVGVLKAHWAGLGVERATRLGAGDLVSYNVCTLSRADLERVRELHRTYFTEVRRIVAASDPECLAVVNVQLLTFPSQAPQAARAHQTLDSTVPVTPEPVAPPRM